MPNIAVINKSRVSDSEVQSVVSALSKQVQVDFAPAWGVTSTSVAFARPNPPPGSWWLVIGEQPDEGDPSTIAGAQGFHDVTDEGQPLGKVYAGICRQHGIPWSLSASHELLEMLGDAHLDRSFQLGGVTYAMEICDPCQEQASAYRVDDVVVSDFVFRSWFDTNGVAPFDATQSLRAPFTVTPLGRLTRMDELRADGEAAFWAQMRPGSRRDRRRKLHSPLKRSQVRW